MAESRLSIGTLMPHAQRLAEWLGRSDARKSSTSSHDLLCDRESSLTDFGI